MKRIFLRLLLTAAILVSAQPAFAMLKSLGMNNEEMSTISPQLVAKKLEIMAAKMHQKTPQETTLSAKPDLKNIARESVYCIESQRLYNNYFSSYFNIQAFEEQMDKYHAVLSPTDVHKVHVNIEQHILQQKHMSDFFKQQELMFIKREVIREYCKRNLEKPGSVDYGTIRILQETLTKLVHNLFPKSNPNQEKVLHHILHRLNRCTDKDHEKLNVPLTRILNTQNNTQK